MITLKQAIRVLEGELTRRKQIVLSTTSKEKERFLAIKEAEALGLALVSLEHRFPRPPIFDPHMKTYICSVCGCIVGFQTQPGRPCFSCPQCMQRVDWNSIVLDK